MFGNERGVWLFTVMVRIRRPVVWGLSATDDLALLTVIHTRE